MLQLDSLVHSARDLLALPAGAHVEGRAPEDLAAMLEIARWAETYLCAPHPCLGRSGPVCPWVRSALTQGFLFLTLERGCGHDRGRMREIVLRYREQFIRMPPREQPTALLKAILILFPDIAHDDAPALIDTTQRELKPHFVREGLMVGQFHERSDEPGLHAADFRPLHAPIPMLVIRHMVLTDIPFLVTAPEYVTSYLEVFQALGHKQLANYLEGHGARLVPERAAMLRDLLRGTEGRWAAPEEGQAS